MDRKSPQRPRTYNDVMNEWAAQREFLGQSRSRILHPPYDAPLPLKIFGYAWRLAVVVLAPLFVFGALLRNYAKSQDFNDDLQPAVLKHLGAAEGEVTGLAWQLDGRLNARTIEARGGPDSFYHELKAKIVTSHLPMPEVFRKSWLIQAVNVDQLSVFLRTGATGEAPVFESEEREELKMNPFLSAPGAEEESLSPEGLPALKPETEEAPSLERLKSRSLEAPASLLEDPPASRPTLDDGESKSLETPSLLDDPPPAAEEEDGLSAAPAPGEEKQLLMTAGYGVNPDPDAIRVMLYRGSHVDLRWGGSSVTTGSLLGAVAELARDNAGWALDASGGRFHLGWLRDLELGSLKALISADRLELRESRLRLPGEPGEIALAGAVAFGALPEADGSLMLKEFPLHRFVTGALADFLQARVTGELKLSGSLNRGTGLEAEGTVTLESGRVAGLPLLRALQTLTGEDQLLQLPVKGGEVRFSTRGSENTGALVVEVSSLEVDCGTLARVEAEGKYEQLPRPPSGTAAGRRAGRSPSDFVLEGEVRFGLAPYSVKKVPPAILSRYFRQIEGKGDWYWISVPLTGRAERLTEALADELVRLHQAAAEEKR